MKKPTRLFPVLALALSLCACASEPDLPSSSASTPVDTHIHSYGSWSITSEASCTQDQISARSCECGYIQEESTAEASGHSLENSSCSQCGLAVCQDLAFTLNEDGQSYSLSGIGECTQTDLIVPDTYKGKPVTAVAFKAFYENTTLTSITLPEGITSIGYSAFYGCTGLKCISLPGTVTEIGNYAFRGCENLLRITLPAELKLIGSYALASCVRLRTIHFLGTHQQWDAIDRIYAWNQGIEECVISCADGKFNLT